MKFEVALGGNAVMFICFSLILAACAPAGQPVDILVSAPAPTPPVMLAPALPEMQKTAAAANTQVALAGGMATADAEATGVQETRTQAAFDRWATGQAMSMAADAATSDARYTQDAATSNAQSTAEARVTSGFETSQAQTAVASETFAYQTATATVVIADTNFERGIQRDRRFFTTWWPVIWKVLLVGVVLVGIVLAWVLAVRGFNLAELKILARDSFDTIVLNAGEANAPWWKHALNWLFGTGGKSVVKPGRSPKPVIEIEALPGPDGHRTHAAELAPPDIQERTTARDQGAALLHEYPIRGTSWQRRSIPAQRFRDFVQAPQTHSLPAPDNADPSTLPLSGVAGEVVEGEYVVVRPGDPAYTRVQPWVADVRGQLTAGGEEETA